MLQKMTFSKKFHLLVPSSECEYKYFPINIVTSIPQSTNPAQKHCSLVTMFVNLGIKMAWLPGIVTYDVQLYLKLARKEQNSNRLLAAKELAEAMGVLAASM